MSFIPYQVDYAIQNTAKTLGFTKKRVIFKFGFANPDAVRRGLAGAQCRGSEHELTFIWSLKNGKRQLFLDGRDVHFSESGQNGWTQDRAWQHAFTMKDATGTYRVHFISQPKNPDLPDSKPFDLRVAGVSYFAFNRIFQLGTPTMTVRENAPHRDSRHHHRGGSGRDSPMSPEERRQVAAAKVESLRDLRSHQEKKSPDRAPAPAPMPREEPNLLSFDDDPPPAPAALPASAELPALTANGQSSYGQFASSTTMDSAWGGAGSGASWEQQAQPQQQFAQLAYGQQPPTQQQSQHGQSALMPSSYGGAPPPGVYGAAPAPAFNLSASSSSFGQPSASYSQLPPAPAPQASFSPFASTSFSSLPTAGSAAPASSATTTALTPYQAPAVNTAAAPAQYASAGAPFSSFAATPTATGTSYQAPQFASPSAQTYASYGSAPSFAQPPPQAAAPASNNFNASSSLGGFAPGPVAQQPPPPISPSASFGGGFAPQSAPATNPSTGYYGAPPAGAAPAPAGYSYAGVGSDAYGFAAPPQQPQPAAYGYPPQPQSSYPGY